MTKMSDHTASELIHNPIQQKPVEYDNFHKLPPGVKYNNTLGYQTVPHFQAQDAKSKEEKSINKRVNFKNLIVNRKRENSEQSFHSQERNSPLRINFKTTLLKK